MSSQKLCMCINNIIIGIPIQIRYDRSINFMKLTLIDLYIILEQAMAYQKTLQTMEMTTKQQQEFTNRTVRDLKDQLSRLTIESAQQEQLTQAIRVDRDRLIREQQAKVVKFL